jgi:hypothetical protein
LWRVRQIVWCTPIFGQSFYYCCCKIFFFCFFFSFVNKCGKVDKLCYLQINLIRCLIA